MEQLKAYLAIFTTIVLFSTIEVAVKLSGTAVDPYLLAVTRFGLAGLLMVLLQMKQFANLTRKDWLGCIGIGVIGLAGTFGPYHAVLQDVPASQVALIFSLNPVFAALTARVVLHEKASINQIIALILGFAGVYVVSFGFHPIRFDSLNNTLLMIWSAAAFGGYTVFNKKMVMKHGAVFTTGITFVISAVTLLPFVGSFEITDPQRAIPILIYLTVFTTFIAYLLYFYGLKRVSVATGSSMFYLKPIIATILAYWILNEKPDAGFITGMAIIFSALFLSMKKPTHSK